jgi:hypothetical protein
MIPLPKVQQPLFHEAAACFRAATLERLTLLIAGYVLTPGRKTISRILQHLHPLLQGHFSCYHRVYSHALWNAPALWQLLGRCVLELLPPGEVVNLAADDSVETRRGRSVWGSGIHRDPLASTRTLPRFTKGHKWLVFAALVPIPFTGRHWALPLRAILIRTPTVDQQLGLRHHTVRQRVRQGLLQLQRWFPHKRFRLLGDWGVACHALARCCSRSSGRLQMIARMRHDTALHDWPTRKGSCRGAKLPCPSQQVKQDPQGQQTLTLAWYGSGQQRTLRYYSDTALWYYHRGGSVVPIRWVWTSNPDTGNADYFYTTDLSLAPEQIIRLYMLRWPVETMFQQVREHLGVQTTRHRCRKSVERVVPLQLAIYSLVTLAYSQLAQRQGCPPLRGTPCYQKDHVTFADALLAVRRELWQEGLLPQCLGAAWQQQLPPELREFLLDHLCQAA